MADQSRPDPAKQARRDRAIAAGIGMAVRHDAQRRAKATADGDTPASAGSGGSALTVVVVVAFLVAMLALVLWLGAART